MILAGLARQTAQCHLLSQAAPEPVFSLPVKVEPSHSSGKYDSCQTVMASHCLDNSLYNCQHSSHTLSSLDGFTDVTSKACMYRMYPGHDLRSSHCKVCGNAMNIWMDLEPSRFYYVKFEISERVYDARFLF